MDISQQDLKGCGGLSAREESKRGGEDQVDVEGKGLKIVDF